MPEFRSLAAMLAPKVAVQYPVSQEQEPQREAAPEREIVDEDHLRDLRLFNASLREALERDVQTLLAHISKEVLGRELLLGPADIAGILAATLERHAKTHPLRVRVHLQDVNALVTCGVPVFADDALQPGDAVIDLRNGSIDVTLATRVHDVLAELVRT